MSDRKDPEFYVGYLPAAPAQLGAWWRRMCVPGLLALALLGGVVSAAFRLLPAAHFEYGTLRTFVGTIEEHPYPALRVRRPGETGELPAYSKYYLVGFGKWGAETDVRGFDNRVVRLRGTLAYRDGQTLIELVAGTLEAVGGVPVEPASARSLGEHRLVGEVVDSKCFLGVMNPGNLKPHRACAARCISGGIPPVFCVRDARGRAEYLLLVDRDGAAVNDRIQDFIAEPVEITGEVLRLGTQLVLKADPRDVRRL